MTVSKSELRDYLVTMAEKHTILYYAELYNHFGYRTGSADDTNPIPMFLGVLMKEDAARGKPLLPSIVVSKIKERPKVDMVPNDTYFTSLCGIRGIPIPSKMADKRKLHQVEREAVFAHYAISGTIIQPTS